MARFNTLGDDQQHLEIYQWELQLGKLIRDGKHRLFITLGADWEALKTWLLRFDFEYYNFLESQDAYRAFVEERREKEEQKRAAKKRRS